MKSSIKALFASMFSILLFSFAAEATVRDVEVHLHNPCRSQGTQCFQLDVYLDGVLSGEWVASPGNPAAGSSSFPAVNTPIYSESNPGTFTSINGRGYVSHRGDPMPYAMHINNSGFAVHGSALKVDGTKQSHGCIRIKTDKAALLNGWMREARAARGLMRITTQDTRN